MAGKLMRAVQYDSYGGGAAALKVNPVYSISSLSDHLFIIIILSLCRFIIWRLQLYD